MLACSLSNECTLKSKKIVLLNTSTYQEYRISDFGLAELLARVAQSSPVSK